MKKDLTVEAGRQAIALISDITYKNEDAWYGETERPLKMSLLAPKHKERQTKPLPLLVWLCGGGLRVMDQNIWMPQLVSFAEQGFVVASVQYRTVNEAPLPAQLIDVKAAIRYLRAHAHRYCIDARNVFVMGESAGAMLAGLTGVTAGINEFDKGDFLDMSSGVNAVIDIYGIADLSAAYEAVRENLVRGAECLDKVGGPADGYQKKLEQFSVVRYVNNKTVPFMILHGTADETVDISQSEALYERLTACGVPCDYYRLIGCIHGADQFYQPEIVELMAEFMKRHLKK